MTMVLLDQCEHQIDPCGDACGRPNAAIAKEDVVAINPSLGKTAPEFAAVLPMGGSAPPVEQPRFAEHECTGADGDNPGDAALITAKPAGDLGLGWRKSISGRATRYHQRVGQPELRSLFERARSAQKDAVPCTDISPGRCDQLGRINLASSDFIGVAEHGPRPTEIKEFGAWKYDKPDTTRTAVHESVTSSLWHKTQYYCHCGKWGGI